ncbi:MAG: hypothetical protein FWF59_03570 [Turicibacter sp.]|nr:hypothetical protein [Turicibacter sp.]
MKKKHALLLYNRQVCDWQIWEGHHASGLERETLMEIKISNDFRLASVTTVYKECGGYYEVTATITIDETVKFNLNEEEIYKVRWLKPTPPTQEPDFLKDFIP